MYAPSSPSQAVEEMFEELEMMIGNRMAVLEQQVANTLAETEALMRNALLVIRKGYGLGKGAGLLLVASGARGGSKSVHVRSRHRAGAQPPPAVARRVLPQTPPRGVNPNRSGSPEPPQPVQQLSTPVLLVKGTGLASAYPSPAEPEFLQEATQPPSSPPSPGASPEQSPGEFPVHPLSPPPPSLEALSPSEPLFKMDRSIESVVDLYREWFEPNSAGLCVMVMEQTSLSWRKSLADKMHFLRRRIVIDTIVSRARATGVMRLTIAEGLEENRQRDQLSLAALGLKLKKDKQCYARERDTIDSLKSA